MVDGSARYIPVLFPSPLPCWPLFGVSVQQCARAGLWGSGRGSGRAASTEFSSNQATSRIGAEATGMTLFCRFSLLHEPPASLPFLWCQMVRLHFHTRRLSQTKGIVHFHFRGRQRLPLGQFHSPGPLQGKCCQSAGEGQGPPHVPVVQGPLGAVGSCQVQVDLSG